VWNTLKYTTIKTWEFKLLDHFHAGVNLLLHHTIMLIPHPTNKKFTLFHSVDKSCFETCHILTVLKSAESYGRALIASLLPYLLYQFASNTKTRKRLIILQWFKLAKQQCAKDAYGTLKKSVSKTQATLCSPLHLPKMMLFTGNRKSPS